METGAATVAKSVGGSSKKLKTELPYDQAILLLGRYLDTCLNWKGTTVALLTAAKTWKQPKCSLTGGCRSCEIQISRPRDDDTEGSKSERQRQIPYDAIHLWRV